MRDVASSNKLDKEKKRPGPQPKETDIYFEEQDAKIKFLDELIRRHDESIKLHRQEIQRLNSLVGTN